MTFKTKTVCVECTYKCKLVALKLKTAQGESVVLRLFLLVHRHVKCHVFLDPAVKDARHVGEKRSQRSRIQSRTTALLWVKMCNLSCASQCGHLWDFEVHCRFFFTAEPRSTQNASKSGPCANVQFEDCY